MRLKEDVSTPEAQLGRQIEDYISRVEKIYSEISSFIKNGKVKSGIDNTSNGYHAWELIHLYSLKYKTNHDSVSKASKTGLLYEKGFTDAPGAKELLLSTIILFEALEEINRSHDREYNSDGEVSIKEPGAFGFVARELRKDFKEFINVEI